MGVGEVGVWVFLPGHIMEQASSWGVGGQMGCLPVLVAHGPRPSGLILILILCERTWSLGPSPWPGPHGLAPMAWPLWPGPHGMATSESWWHYSIRNI